jgi:arylsulfatase A-like enzyme
VRSGCRLPARRWAAQAAALSRRADVDVEGVDRALAAALVAGMANELDAIFGRIIDRLDKHARDHPTAGRA